MAFPPIQARGIGGGGAAHEGLISGAQTLEASFGPVDARYIKLSVEYGGTAIDEIEVFGPPS